MKKRRTRGYRSVALPLACITTTEICLPRSPPLSLSHLNKLRFGKGLLGFVREIIVTDYGIHLAKGAQIHSKIIGAFPVVGQKKHFLRAHHHRFMKQVMTVSARNTSVGAEGDG